MNDIIKEENPLYYGLDVHKTFIQVASVESASGPVIESKKIPVDMKTIDDFTNSLNSSDHVVLESTNFSSNIASLLRRNGANVIISNPMRTKMIADSKVKTDKIDAEALARLIACNYIPEVWQPSLEIEEFRKLISFANAIICQRTVVKNRIHSILQRNLVNYTEIPNLFNGRGLKFLKGVSLPEAEKFHLDMELRLLEDEEKNINTIKQRIALKAYNDEDSKRLMTISGVDFYTAFSLKAAIGDISRFKSPKKLVGYFGLSPRIYQSANFCSTGPITKHGRSHARWVLTQAAHYASLTPGPLKAFFKRIKRRTVRNKAIVAVSSKLTRIIWNMLAKKQDYLFAHPLRTKEKFAKLRIIATGVKLNPGRKKTEPPRGGGKKEYLAARKRDHDNAIMGEKEYEYLMKTRLPKNDKK